MRAIGNAGGGRYSAWRRLAAWRRLLVTGHDDGDGGGLQVCAWDGWAALLFPATGPSAHLSGCLSFDKRVCLLELKSGGQIPGTDVWTLN
jgi:hypothetical protein